MRFVMLSGFAESKTYENAQSLYCKFLTQLELIWMTFCWSSTEFALSECFPLVFTPSVISFRANILQYITLTLAKNQAINTNSFAPRLTSKCQFKSMSNEHFSNKQWSTTRERVRAMLCVALPCLWEERTRRCWAAAERSSCADRCRRNVAPTIRCCLLTLC